MGTALYKIKIMPSSPDISLDEIEENAKKVIEEQQGKNLSFEREPIAFGLTAVILTFARDEELDQDKMLDALDKMQDVSSAEVIDYRRAFG